MVNAGDRPSRKVITETEVLLMRRIDDTRPRGSCSLRRGMTTLLRSSTNRTGWEPLA